MIDIHVHVGVHVHVHGIYYYTQHMDDCSLCNVIASVIYIVGLHVHSINAVNIRNDYA